MPRGHPPTTVTLTDDERQRLNTLARRSRSASQLARRRTHHPGLCQVGEW